MLQKSLKPSKDNLLVTEAIHISLNISECTPGCCEAVECRHLTYLRKERKKGKQGSSVLNPLHVTP